MKVEDICQSAQETFNIITDYNRDNVDNLIFQVWFNK